MIQRKKILAFLFVVLPLSSFAQGNDQNYDGIDLNRLGAMQYMSFASLIRAWIFKMRIDKLDLRVLSSLD